MKQLLTIPGLYLIVTIAMVAATVMSGASIRRFDSPQKLVSYLGLNPMQSEATPAYHGRIVAAGFGAPGRTGGIDLDHLMVY